MAKKESEITIPDEAVLDKIYLIRGKKVMLDRDLAQLYNVETKVLKQAVRRNKDRFPDDFMFELSNEEFTILRSQIVTSIWGKPAVPLWNIKTGGITKYDIWLEKNIIGD